ncbi:Biogenesis of lysosome-related organelles complex 1 subunit 5 [Exaiptasia diaphana]|nr:Biogenesis of lysosome-related organelles complex 1 subunit 5 [Exaiptasia diaphana]
MLPIIQSECKYFVREFEGKRNDREVERLNESLQKVRQIEEEIPKCVEKANQFEELKQQLRAARQSCHDILVKEEEDLQHERREQIKEDAKKDWEKFQLEMNEEEEKIRKEFEQEAEKLREKYGVKQATIH